MNLGGSAQRLSSSFGKTEIAYLAFLHELCHRANGFFNWSAGIDAMLVIQVDMIDAKPPQTSFTSLADVFWLTIHAARLRISWIANNTKFRSDHNLIALSLPFPQDSRLYKARRRQPCRGK